MFSLIEAKAEEHLIRLTSRMDWFPIAYHLADKVALVVFPVLAYYTGKYQLNDTMTFLWAMAFMPIFVLSAIWGINELAAYLERRKKEAEVTQIVQSASKSSVKKRGAKPSSRFFLHRNSGWMSLGVMQK